jgi:hypothetical protein
MNGDSHDALNNLWDALGHRKNPESGGGKKGLRVVLRQK